MREFRYDNEISLVFLEHFSQKLWIYL